MYKCCFLAFLRETARPVAKSRTNSAQIREKLPTGWADWHQIWRTCANSYGNGYTPNKLPLETQGGHLGVLGGKQFKGMGKLSDWHQLWFTFTDSSGNGDRLNASRPSIPQGALGGGGVRVSQIEKSGEAVKRLDRLAPNLAHICRSSGNGHTPNKLPLATKGGTWGVLGVNIQKSWEAVKRLDRLAPHLANICRSIWEWLYAKQIASLDTRGHFGGF